ncbi:MAG: hypothetical protein KDA96_22780, partial [Planctomycetaceae bacterium]|nr:hypothetical protein [Planctomycetaceae bacterium]
MFDSDHESEFHHENWQTVHGPANWFSLRCPPELTFRKTETCIEFRVAGTAGGTGATGSVSEPVLLVAATWVEANVSAAAAAMADPTTLFPRPERFEQHAVPLGAPDGMALAGISRQPSTKRGLRRWFARIPAYYWWIWQFSQLAPGGKSAADQADRESRAGLVVIATLQFPEGRPVDSQLLCVCQQMIATLKLSDHPVWPPDVFRRRVIELARSRFPLQEICSAPDFSIRIADSAIGLSNFYRSYLLQPEE